MENHAYQPDVDDNNSKPFVISGYATRDSTVRPNYFVEINSRSKLKPTFYRNLSILLGILLLLILITLITILIIYSKFNQPIAICTSDECLRSATNLRYSLDLSVNPCENFYQYVCGHWSNEHPNHGWFPSFSTFATVSERILIATEQFLKSSTPLLDDEPKPVQQARDFYKSCMDQDSIDNLGLTVIYQYLEQLELPLIPSLFTKTIDEIVDFKFDWLKSEAMIKRIFSMDIFIGFIVDANIVNRTENIMYLGVPYNICPLPTPLKRTKLSYSIDKYINDDDDDDNGDDSIDFQTLKIETNKKIIRFVMTTIIKNQTDNEPNETTLEEAINVILNISQFIDDLIDNYTEPDDYYSRPYLIRDYEKLTNDFLINNINKDYPQIWEIYLNYLFDDPNITIDLNSDYLYIEDSEVDYSPKLLSYLLTTSDIYLELYIWWVTVYTMIINTTSDIVDYITKQTSPFYQQSDIVVTRSRSLDCCELVNRFMGMAVAYGLVDRRTFANHTKPKVEQMLSDIKNAFVQHVKNIKWMDEPTKLATLEKAKETISFIGYPDWLFEQNKLDDYYHGVIIQPDTYLENMMNLIKIDFPNKLTKLRQINERDWSIEPVIVNAFNSFQDNSINIPMAILTFPFYNLGLEVLNYAAIGSIIGHELTHGFDNKGRKHDKFGNYRQWWTNETIQTFENKIQCFVKQYDNYTIDGLSQHVAGMRTLGENLADNGGLNHALIAYRYYVKRFGMEPKLPGFENFTDTQLFFVAYASIWCETQSLEDLEAQIEYDEHSPNRVRVIGTLQNSEEFSKAFKCPKGSYMNPKNKCRIW